MALQINDVQYGRMKKFINAISDRNDAVLSDKIKLTNKIILEIYELLPNYFATGAALSAPPQDSHLPKENLGALITVYDIGDGEVAVECFILEGGEPSEAILHLTFTGAHGEKLNYEFIDS